MSKIALLVSLLICQSLSAKSVESLVDRKIARLSMKIVDRSLTDSIKAIESEAGVQIVLKTEHLSERQVSGQLSDVTLEEGLKVLLGDVGFVLYEDDSGRHILHVLESTTKTGGTSGNVYVRDATEHVDVPPKSLLASGESVDSRRLDIDSLPLITPEDEPPEIGTDDHVTERVGDDNVPGSGDISVTPKTGVDFPSEDWSNRMRELNGTNQTTPAGKVQ